MTFWRFVEEILNAVLVLMIGLEIAAVDVVVRIRRGRVLFGRLATCSPFEVRSPQPNAAFMTSRGISSCIHMRPSAQRGRMHDSARGDNDALSVA